MKSYYFEFINSKTGEQIKGGVFHGKNKKEAKNYAIAYKRRELGNRKHIKTIS